MGKINVLGFDIANLIAAGEVVDRPASVVKELLENAIDSGASRITVEIKNGGVTFIRVADNGCGIEHEDLPTAILRHATSKIKDATDLEAIMTLGFRGEALAAISSVSKIRIMSKRQNEEMGSILEAHAGQVVSHMRAGSGEGTTVIVEDLFYNVPARKKFLKKDSYEASCISTVVEKVAMSRPDISFRYIIDGEVKYITAGDGSTQNAIYAILGRDVAKKSIKVLRNENGIKVEGFISSPELVRGNRNLEIFYINSRSIKSGIMSKALEQAFQSYIPSDKFPVCVLNLEISPNLVDVNVHPAKLEVKFSNDQIIFDAIYYAVRTALSSEISTPSLYETKESEKISSTPFPVNDREAPKPDKIVFDTQGNFGIENKDKTISYSYGASQTQAPRPKIELPKVSDDDFVPDFLTKYDKPSLKVSAPSPGEIISRAHELQNEAGADIPFAKENTSFEEKIENKIIPDYKIIGEAFNSYVIVELGNILYLIDKHAAHERIIFEDLKKKINEKSPSSQVLLFPIEARLTSMEIGICDEWRAEINKTGFAFDIQGETVYISELPSEIETSAGQDAFFALISKLNAGEATSGSARYEIFEKALYQASCKAAIKAGRAYEKEHIKWIVDRVLTLDNIKYCPHGRPVAFEITRHFLEKEFERIK